MLYLVTCETPGTPPPPTVATLEAGQAALEQIGAWEREGRVRGAGVYSGRSGMAFIIDAASNSELHTLVASLPTFMQASWEVIPMLSID
jgi:hypothetical protein